jgi:hypothetical protein
MRMLLGNYIGTGQVYTPVQFLGDVRYEISTGHDDAVSNLTGTIYAQNSLEFIAGGELPELTLKMRKEQLQFQFEAVRTEFELAIFVYTIVFRSPLKKMT